MGKYNIKWSGIEFYYEILHLNLNTKLSIGFSGAKIIVIVQFVTKCIRKHLLQLC